MRDGTIIRCSILCSILLVLVQHAAAIPVNVMLPLDTVSNTGSLNNPTQLMQQFEQLKQGNVDGIMTDVWWGIVEAKGPRQYNWQPYIELVELARNASLKVQVVMSFHQCGTNVGDACYIPLPSWVVSVGSTNPSIWYTDTQGNVDEEYLSLGVDNQTLFKGRTAVEMYTDYMQSFADTFQKYFPGVINQVQIGLGPAGEMRYPSYQLQDNKWQYCGIGEFQCSDKYMLADLAQAAKLANHTDWGYGPPDNAGTYDSYPDSTGFFSNGNDNYQSPYGQFFLTWYSNALLQHGETILKEASSIFAPLGVSIAAKVSGIHWWYLCPCHAAEVTAGYYNTNNNNAYLEIANMFAKYKVEFDFTCLEMTDSDNGCGSAPQELVKQTILAAQQAGIRYAGENALPLCQPNCYQGGFDEIYTESTQYGNIAQFTYLRMDSNLLDSSNWPIFTAFVQRMHSAG